MSAEETAAALAACPTPAWRAIFALARFGGLRTCEVAVLTWGDVLWDVQRLRIDSPKTGLRTAPIAPELMPVLREAFDAAVDGEILVAGQRYSDPSGIGTILTGILERRGRSQCRICG